MGALGGRTALVTGASRGIGRAIAIALAEEGAAVAVHYNTGEREAREIQQKIEANGGRGITVQADLARAEAAAPLIERTRASLGPVDILVNNAGMAIHKPWHEIDLADWDATYAVNIRSQFLLCREVIPGMRERRWGRLIFLSSVAAHTGGVVGPHYASSKAAQVGLMHSYASLLVKEGITSNAIAPALIETGMIAEDLRRRGSPLPVGRFGDVEEVAQVAVMLATNAFMTGQTINVDGGWYFS